MTRLYLAAHPNRGIRREDRVLHCGSNTNQRGRKGVVLSPNVVGKVRVFWNDAHAANEYSIDFALNNFGVDIDLIRRNSGAFAGNGYVNKYIKWAIEKEDLFETNFEFANHVNLKRMHSGLHNIQKIKQQVLELAEPKTYSYIALREGASAGSTPVAYGDTVEEIREALMDEAQHNGTYGKYIIMKAMQELVVEPIANYKAFWKAL